MSHRHRPAFLNLLTEQRNNRSVRSQHIAEAGRHELRLTLFCSVLDRMVQALYVDFADALRTAHDIRRVHGLVGRHHHKLLHAVLHAQVCNHLRTIDVVLHSLRGVVLHHRHMLVGSSMEHIVGLELPEDSLHAVSLANARHHRLSLYLWIIVGHHQPDIVFRRLSLVNQYHCLRFILSNLSHQFTADAAGSTGNQDTATVEQFTHRLHVHLNLIAGQQVFHADLFQLDVPHPTAFLQVRSTEFLGTLGHEYLHPRGQQLVLKVRVIAETLCLQWRDQHCFYFQSVNNWFQIVGSTIHLLTHYQIMLIGVIRGNKALHHEVFRTLGTNVLGQSDAALMYAINQCTQGPAVGHRHVIK